MYACYNGIFYELEENEDERVEKWVLMQELAATRTLQLNLLLELL
jgi:hypothetical protein